MSTSRKRPSRGALVSEPELYDGVARGQRGVRDLPVWLHLAAESRGPVLELGAGTCRVLVALLDAGLDAYGLEVDEARHAAGRKVLAAHGHDVGRLIVGDARSWSAAQPMALVLATFNFLALFDDQGATEVLAAVRDNLGPGGNLAMEAQVWPGDGLVGGVPKWSTRVSVEVGSEAAQYREFVQQQPHGLLRVRRQFSFDDGSKRELLQELRIRSADRLQNMLRSAGFAVLSPVLDEQGRPPNAESRIVFIQATLGWAAARRGPRPRSTPPGG